MGFIIVNADDFGLRPSINAAVIDLASRGLISSATIMVKGDAAALDEALRFARAHGGPAGFGLHLDFDDYFHLGEAGRYGAHDGDIDPGYGDTVARRRAELRADLRRQIQTMRSAGVEPTHLDGHHHVHLFLPILAEVVLPVMIDEGLRRLRFSAGFYTMAAAAAAARGLLARAGIATTDWFADLGALMAHGPAAPDGATIGEIMTHVEWPGPGAESWRADQYRWLMDRGNGLQPLAGFGALPLP